MKPAALLFPVTICLFCSWTLSTAASCNLLPENGNPAQIDGIFMSPLARRVNSNFASGPVSDRFYDHVEPLDGITLGFGHWPQQEVEGFFRDMSTVNNGHAFRAFADCTRSFFGRPENAGAWVAARKAGGLANGDPTPDNVAAVLRNTLLSKDFMKRYRKHCAQTCTAGEPDLYHEHKRWLLPVLRFSLRDSDVVVWQVDFWTRTIVDQANGLAAKVGLKDDEAAVVAAAAYRSSAPAWFNDVVTASQTGTLTLRGQTWQWSDPPAGAARDEAGLKRWRRLILWQHYANHVWLKDEKKGKKERIRARSQKFFDDYLAEFWVLPDLTAAGKPNWKSERNLQPALVKPKG